MFLTTEQIKELLDIINRNQSIAVVKEFGPSFLTDSDKSLLEDSGIDWQNLYDPALDTILTSFHFGILSEALGYANTNKVSYEQLKEYITKGAYIPITARETATVNSIKWQALTSLKSLNNRIFADVNKILTDSSVRGQAQFLEKELKQGYIDRKTVSQVSNEIALKTGDWSRDFDRIVEYASQTAFEQGKAATIERQYGEDQEVFKKVYNGACKYCIKLYLTEGIGSEPRIFKLNELTANGSNIGRKVDEWKPTIDATHPYCFSDDTEVMTNEGWKLFQDLHMNELFLSVNPQTEKSEWIKAVQKVQYHYKGKMDSFKGFTFDLLTTPNHRHFIRKTNNEVELISGENLKITNRFIRASSGFNGNNLKQVKIGSLNFEGKDFCHFMGWWLSEGSFTNHNGSWQLHITQWKEKNKQEIEQLCKRLFKIVWVGENFSIPIKDEEAIIYFKQFGLSNQKFIPKEIKEAPTQHLEIFLQAYLKGDGTKHRGVDNYLGKFNEQEVYSTNSKQMSSDIGELIFKIGDCPSYHSVIPKEVIYQDGKKYISNYPQIIITRCKTKNTRLCKLKRIEVDYDGMVYDVELEKNHTLVVRRNGKVTVSGNCRCNLVRKPKGYIWNKATQMFDIPDSEYKPKTTSGNARPKVRAWIGNQEIFV